MNFTVFTAIPPFTQLNTPYPSTAYIKGFLNTKNIACQQADFGIETILNIFCKEGLQNMFNNIAQKQQSFSPNSSRIIALQKDYIRTIDDVIAFLQGKNPTLALQICLEDFLPEAARFEQLDDLEWAFGIMGTQDKAKHLATLYLEDLSDLIIECVDDHFGFSRYAEKLGRSANSFDELYNSLLNHPSSYIDVILHDILQAQFTQHQPNLLLLSVPFPGNLYSAFKIAQWFKHNYPKVKIALGGGFANTELRNLSDVRVFEFVDFVTLDDGETPIEELVNAIKNNNYQFLKRTFLLQNNQVFYNNLSTKKDYKQAEVGTPDYTGLQLDKYISVIEMANPMHRMWSDGRWNKLTMAHGCYWGKCTFCDISLDYIKIYEPVTAKLICDRMEELYQKTGVNGFHFVDEAAPPALMKALALEIIKRNLVFTWWTNIRFEKSFTKDSCLLLKQSGCIAVSGGLEVASDRLLNLIDKGVTVAQVANVTKNLTEAGIMVHAYLMYGYPTQTEQETIDSLEMVKQMFEEGILQSGFWHQFALTAHSPIGVNPSKYGLIIQNNSEGTFANNDIEFTDSTKINHDKFSDGLKKSLFNFMHGICLDKSLQYWFDFKIPKPTIANNFIFNCLNQFTDSTPSPNAKIIWLGNSPTVTTITTTKKGVNTLLLQLDFHSKKHFESIKLAEKKGVWLANILNTISVYNSTNTTFKTFQESYEKNNFPESFILFWNSKNINTLKNLGLLVL